jgi:hypothetical protein
MIYFSLALLIVAIALGALHFAERRADKPGLVTNMIVAVVVLAVGVSSNRGNAYEAARVASKAHRAQSRPSPEPPSSLAPP